MVDFTRFYGARLIAKSPPRNWKHKKHRNKNTRTNLDQQQKLSNPGNKVKDDEKMKGGSTIVMPHRTKHIGKQKEWKRVKKKNTVLLSGTNNIITRNTAELGFIVDSLNWINVLHSSQGHIGKQSTGQRRIWRATPPLKLLHTTKWQPRFSYVVASLETFRTH